MERKDRIEQEVMKTLQGLDDLENIETSPFLYTRLQARIQSLHAQQERRKIFGMTHLRLVFLIFLVAVNVFSIIFVVKNAQYQSDARQMNITAFANEYALTQNDTDLFLTN